MHLGIGLDQLRFDFGDRNLLALFELVVELRPEIRDMVGEVRVGLALRGCPKITSRILTGKQDSSEI
jgi:hypothetical protein